MAEREVYGPLSREFKVEMHYWLLLSAVYRLLNAIKNFQLQSATVMLELDLL